MTPSVLGFDWTIRLGDVLTMGGALFVGASIFVRHTRHDISEQLSIKHALDELKEIKSELKTFSVTIKKIAVQEMQISLLMKWYDELRHGSGFVRGEKPGSIDREYTGTDG